MKTFFDPKVNAIHLDMDGVLADFDLFVLENMGRTFDHASGPADKEMWNFLSKVDHLYLQLQPTPYCQQLVDLARSLADNVEILTAIPRRTTMATAEQDKIDWAKQHISGAIKVKIGPYSRDKWKHCKRGDILVDDRQDNIRDWINFGGGIGILHDYSDYPKTAERLVARTSEK